jgi:hypothetical protein
MNHRLPKFLRMSPRMIVILLLWISSILLVNITGEFPLLDDWAYAKSVRDLSEFGEFHIYDRIAVTFFSNLIWGTLFAKTFGFSFLILRISTIVASLLLIFVFNKWLGLFKIDDKLKGFCLLVLAFNPFLYFLGVTFMTDIFFLLNMCTALYFFTRYFNEKHIRLLLFAVLFSIVATLGRQIGLVLPVAFFIVVLISKQHPWKQKIHALGVAAVSIGALSLYYLILSRYDLTPSHYTMHYNILSNDLGNYDGKVFFRWVYYLYISTVSLIVLLSPLFTYYLYGRSINWKRAIVVFISCLGLVLLIKVFLETSFPFNGIILNEYGMGTYAYADQASRIALLSDKIPNWISVIIVSLSLSVFCYLILDEFKSIRTKIKESKIAQLLITVAILYYPTFGLVYVFDRYLALYVLILIPLSTILFNRGAVSSKKPIPYVILAVFTLIMLLGVNEFFTYNRTKWEALHALHAEGISPKEIDGGNEYNTWYNYENDDLHSEVGKEWWCVYRDDYMVTVDSELPGYEIYKSYPYSSWLGLKKRNLYILKKTHRPRE